jgi:hypothetical protein
MVLPFSCLHKSDGMCALASATTYVMKIKLCVCIYNLLQFEYSRHFLSRYVVVVLLYGKGVLSIGARPECKASPL